MLSDDHFKAGTLGDTLRKEQIKRELEAQVGTIAVAKTSTLQEVSQGLRALMAEARRSEDYSEGLLARLTGSDAMNPKPLEGDGPSNGFISDTLELITLLESTLERSNGNLRRLQNAVMPYGVEEAAE